MTRKFSRNSLVIVVVSLTLVLILSVAFGALAQMTGTGHAQDAVVPAGLDAASKSPWASGIERWNSPVNFARVVRYNSGEWYTTSVAVGDLNGDGHLDLVVASYPGVVTVLQLSQPRLFRPKTDPRQPGMSGSEMEPS
jgi:hypothetical protein